MVDPDVLSARLSALEGYLVELRDFLKWSEDEFAHEPALHHLAERYLHLACEAVIDIVHHLIADEGLRQPANNRDAVQILREEGYLPTDLADRLEEWMGFRNVLVHLYLDIDHRRTYAAIRDDLGDLEDFAAAVGALL